MQYGVQAKNIQVRFVSDQSNADKKCFGKKRKYEEKNRTLYPVQAGVPLNSRIEGEDKYR